jgi:hypothetical protein
MFTLLFWKAAFERAIKSAAQFAALAYFGGDVAFNVFEANWGNMAGVILGAILFSLLTSLGSAALTDGNPSVGSAEVLSNTNGRHEAV